MGIDRSLFVDEVPADCVCSICQEVLEDAKETLTCQHAFCNACICRWLQEHFLVHGLVQRADARSHTMTSYRCIASGERSTQSVQ